MNRAHGFSLMEVLAALVLLTILLLGVYSGVRTATQTVRAGTAAAQRLDQIRSAQQLLRRELAQAMAAPIARDDHGDSIFFKGSAQQMSYVAPLPGYLGKLGAQLQTLSLVDDGSNGKRLQLQLALLPPDGKPPQPLGEPQVLLDHVAAGGFFYRGVDAQGHVGNWKDSWPDGRLLPSLVRVQLQARGTTPWPQLDAPLRIDPASGLMQAGMLRQLMIQGQPK
jgi:general secretion pathway protein J